jgi:phage terminase large subunit GpA-like protein
MLDGVALYREAFSAGLIPDPDLSVAEWSNRHRILSQKGAAEPGPYRVERTPYLKEILENLSPKSPVQRIVFMKSAQVGASEAGFNWLGYIMHAAPGPAMMVQPTTELAEKVSKQRISSMIDETPVLREMMGPEKAKNSSQTILMKEFPGGVLAMVGANSPVGLRSMPVRYLFCDEVDAYPKDVGGADSREGDPVSLAEKRTTTFTRRKVFLVSTPTVKDASRIEFEYLGSDQRRFFVPCPHCGVLQWLQWRNIKWQDDDPRTARYQCEHCNVLIEERFKTKMLESGEWQATAQGDGKTIGYHISALYSPVGWKSWAEIVEEFLKVKADGPQLKTWVNTVLGESFEEEYSTRLGADGLMSRVELYEAGVAPAGVLVITAGVDIQDNRFEIKRIGWGKDEEAWVIDHSVIHGDPSKPEIWKQLDNFLIQPVKHETHADLRILAAAVDSGGHFTHEVYQFARTARPHGQSVLAVKGQSQRGKVAIGPSSKVDVNYKGQILKKGARVFPIGTDTIKSTLFARLKHNEPGPGYIHFHSDLGPDYFEQLTSEKQVTRYIRGFPVKEWVKKSGARNEALDCFVYGFAALQFILNQFNRKTVWEQLSKRMVEKSITDPNKGISGQVKPARAMINTKRSNFVTKW